MKVDREAREALEHAVTLMQADMGLPIIDVTPENHGAYVQGLDAGLRIAADAIQLVLDQAGSI